MSCIPRPLVLMLCAGAIFPSAAEEVQGARAERLENRMILDNGIARLELNVSTGEIVSLTPGPPSLRGPWFEVVEEDRRGLAAWEYWERGEEAIFSGGPAEATWEVRDGHATARLVWQRPNGMRYEAELLLRPRDAGPLVRMTVANVAGSALVDTLRFPLLRGIELDDPEDDWFTWPHTLGARFRVRGFAPATQLQQAYPDFIYMQWLDLFDAHQGVYVGCLDDYGYSKDLLIGRDLAGQSLMGIVFTGCWVAEAGDQWTTPWVQIVGHAGDWRAGADFYRDFAQAAFGPLDPPERVREMPTTQCWLAHHASDGDVGRLFEIQQQAPIHASYLMKSLNTSIPEGWDGFRGSALELQESFQKIRTLGGSPALFTFDRAPLMGHPNYAEHVGRWTCRRRDGSFAEGFRDIMPSPVDPDLVRARVGEAVRWVRAFGIDEIHLDTDATCGPSLAGPSYDPTHPQRPNEVPHYYKALYRAIRDGCRQYNPEFLLRAEHCADFLYPEFLTSTAHFFETGTLVAAHNPPTDAQLMPILFRYTLPRHAALQMPSMSGNDFWTFGYGMGHGFHGGGPSWCFNPKVREAESPPGSLLERYRFYDAEWRRYYDFRVGFEEAVVDAERSDVVAEALIDGHWQPCEFPGPVVAVTHCGGGREVTLGQWYHLSHSQYFAERFTPNERLAPRPIRLRVPTRLAEPQVRLHGEMGEVAVEPVVTDGLVECEIADPTCFALEVFEGPAVTLELPEVARPGQAAEVGLRVVQRKPANGQITLCLPVGWPEVETVAVPPQSLFATQVSVRVPPGIFGRNYPIKAVLRMGDLKRTVAGHLRVMEPLTVLYDFDTLGKAGPTGLHALEPGKRARLTVTCVNNMLRPADLRVEVAGDQVSGVASAHVEGLALADLRDPQSALLRWTEGHGGPPTNAFISNFDFDCAGVPTRSVAIRVFLNGAESCALSAWPRTRIMDLNGDWKVQFMRLSRALTGGAERLDNLDTEAVTPSVWDGGWERRATPIHFDDQVRKDSSWAIYRRLIFVPKAWQGAQVWLRLPHTGGPWGAGGTLNLVYVNGWPAGRVGSGGECMVEPFVVFGGWNLLAIASFSPNSLVDPYLFVRGAPAPSRIQPASPSTPPAGAFLLLGQRCTGQGITLPFVQGVPEGDHRRTNVAGGGEQVFIYFAIADEYLREPTGPVAVEVEYLDEGTCPFGLDYDSTDETAPIKGAFKSAEPVTRTNTGQWRTHVFRLEDARFANREHLGADMRLWAQGEDLRVRRIEVRPGR